uniref:putative reverse transcriptase/maturase n=1 Tax=Timspurckia oligopyrenoides TaxID=708627 RepID=UPI001FCCE64E|nr:putative reverse transcriptase/maturase [Timspurckia oligopyrenoides]UNJ17452.1 putative reverse transcriptase/maturase [Timspurckia oligopyrenoides]
MISNYVIDTWDSLPWITFRKNLFQLQCKIYAAKQKEDDQAVVQLQELLMTSKSARFLAVHETIQSLEKYDTSQHLDSSFFPLELKFHLVLALKDLKSWKCQPIMQIPFVNQNSEKHQLTVLGISDSCLHRLIKYALEPVCEVLFAANSFASRPGRCAHDIQKHLYLCLHKQRLHTNILYVNLEQCLNPDSQYDLVSNTLLPPSSKALVYQAFEQGLKISYAEARGSSVLSPIFGNILMNGIENLGNDVLCYGGKIVFILGHREHLLSLLNNLRIFLLKRGLNFKLATIQILKTSVGFDFLDWYFLVKPNGKFASIPRKENLVWMKKKVKMMLRDTRLTIFQRLQKIKKFYSRWWCYHQYCDLGKIKVSLWSLSTNTYKYLRKNTNMGREETLGHINILFNGYTYRQNSFSHIQANNSPFDINSHQFSSSLKSMSHPISDTNTKTSAKACQCSSRKTDWFLLAYSRHSQNHHS